MTTYSQLVADVYQTIDRPTDDPDLSPMTDTFIQLAEEWHRDGSKRQQLDPIRTRDIRVRSRNDVDGSRYVGLPDDYLDMQALRVLYAGYWYRLDDVSSAGMRSDNAAGYPTSYTIHQEIELNRPWTGELEMVYYKTWPGLSVTNASNWLSVKAYGCYLHATLYHVYAYLKDDEDQLRYKGLYADSLSGLLTTDRRGRRFGARTTVSNMLHVI